MILYLSPELVKELTKPRHRAHASSSDKAFVQVDPDESHNIFTGLLLLVGKVISVIRSLKRRVIGVFTSASNYMAASSNKHADRACLQRMADIPFPEPFRDVFQIVAVLVFRSFQSVHEIRINTQKRFILAEEFIRKRKGSNDISMTNDSPM